MRNELWQALLEHNFTEKEINKCIFKIRKEGSPYVVVEEHFDTRMAGSSREIAVNPFIRLGKVLAPLIEDREFCDSPEGQLLFHEVVQLTLDMDRVSGADRDTFVKGLVCKEIAGGCYGKKAAEFLASLNMQEKSAVLDFLLRLYRGGREPFPFIGVVMVLFPRSVIFREKQKPDILYIYMDTKEDERQLARYESAKALFLPIGFTVKLSWEQPFILTDIHNLEQYGNTLI